jgi:rubrerythrin
MASEKLTKIMEATFKGETMEVGLYLAMAKKEKADVARIAREEGFGEAATFFDGASRDENRHRSGLEGFLKKLK